MVEPWRPRVTVAAVAERDDCFLLVEEKARGRLVLNQPAGHLEPGESLLDAVKRETLEETCYRFEPQALIGIYRWTTDNQTYLRFAFRGVATDRDETQHLDPVVTRVVWMSVAELDTAVERMRSPLVQAAINDYLAGRCYPLECLQELDSDQP